MHWKWLRLVSFFGPFDVACTSGAEKVIHGPGADLGGGGRGGGGGGGVMASILYCSIH